MGDAPNYNIECWTEVKNTLGLDFPNLPYMIDPNEGVKITDPAAIITFLCKQHAPELMGSSIEIRTQIDMLHQKIDDTKNDVTGPCYIGMSSEKLAKLALAKINPIVQYLGNEKEFMCGELTYIDF